MTKLSFSTWRRPSNTVGLVESGDDRDVMEDNLDCTLDTDFTNPIRHYIREMAGMTMLAKEGEKAIAIKMEQAKEEIKQIILSFPGTVRELLAPCPSQVREIERP